MRISCRGLGVSGLGRMLPMHGPLPETAAEFESSDRRKRLESWLTKPGISNNVGGVKHFSSVRIPALGGARHFALVEKCANPIKARSQSIFRSGTRSDPCISSVTTLIMITTSNSSEGGAGCPINFSMFYCTPSPGSSWPACEPNFFTCS